MRPLRLVAVAALSGLLAGAACGAIDGLRAATGARLDGPGIWLSALLAAATYALLGGLGAAVLAKLALLRRWGRAREAPTWARAASWVAMGGLAALPPALALWGTAARVNRFLAAGLVVLAQLAACLAVPLLQPALARLLALGRARPPATFVGGRRWLEGANLLLVPLTLAALDAALFLVVWRTRAPLRRAVLVERTAWVVALAALAPGLLAWLSVRGRAWWPRMRGGVALGLALAAGAIAAAWLGVTRWESDLQYVPWQHGLAVVVLSGAATAVVRALRTPLARRGALPLAGIALAGLALAVAGVLHAGAAEPARKAVTARAALVGPVLTVARRALDFDRDGHPFLLGGGDCDEGDPGINPAALDWPGDGLDQDCDGHDASLGSLAPGPFHDVPSSVPRDLNVLLVAIDTLRADHLGCYGYGRATSPVLDALAREGVLFENGWAHAPSTRYSMPAIVTGRWPSTIEWNNSIWWPGLGPGVHTIYQAMKALGYTNAAFWSYLYFDPSAGRGFERAVDVYEARRAALHQNVEGPAESVGSSAREIADDGIRFLDEQGARRKWFLTLHFYDPHLSYQKHPEVTDFGDAPVDRYDNEIRFTDLQIGRVFDRLRALGLWDKTVVMVTGDHGEGLGERGVLAHGYHLYPPQTKVPFIVRVPGVSPRRVAAPVGHVDLAPTLVNLVGGERPPAFLGSSAVDLLLGRTRAEPPVVFQEVSYEGDNKKRALVSRTHQLIWNWTPHNTTECYALDGGDLEAPDIWGTSAGGEACVVLKKRLRELVALLSLPADFRDRIGADVFPPGRTPPAPAHPPPGDGAKVGFGDAVALVGYDLPAVPIARGQAVPLALHFRISQRVPEGWKLFVHLDGPAGSFDNLDHAPVGGAYPVERWQPGETIIDRHTFTIAPHRSPGRYTLSLGFWRGNQRLPVVPATVSDGRERLRLVEFEVR